MFKDAFKKEIASLVSKHLEMPVEEKDIIKYLTIPPDFALGQASLPTFPFAKALKQPPNQIAQTLSDKINAEEKTFIEKVESVNAYLNFHCNFQALTNHFEKGLQTNSFFTESLIDPTEKEKIIVEYSQPNTHKAMHVGHLRCLVLGAAVSNLLEYAGHDVIRATYPGDIGAHVAKIIWYLSRKNQTVALPRHENIISKANWLGKMYVEADEVVNSTKGTNQESEIKKQISEVFHQINQKSGDYYELWKETRQWSLDYLKEIYRWLKTDFDIWYFESECEEPSKELVLKKYQEGFFVKDQGAIGIDLSDYKLGFVMFLKSDGHGLYLTKDLDLLAQKFQDPKVTKSIYVVDSRQKLHFKQLFKTAELMGYPQAAKSVHLAYETVNTEDGAAFSSRSLNGIDILSLKDKMESKVTQDYLERYRNQWSEEQIENTARDVTIGALKYGLLRVDNNTQIHFSESEWLKLDGDTGPYLQYVHARCFSILEKLGKPKESFDPIYSEKEEKELLFLLWRFNEFALLAASQYRPSVIAGYLYDLARYFNRFYEHCSIKSSEGNVKETRLFLVSTTQKIMACGLNLLGIGALERM